MIIFYLVQKLQRAATLQTAEATNSIMTDPELIILIQNGNTNAFRYLVDQNRKLVWHLVLRMIRVREDAEDLSQEIFLRVFRDIRKFRGESKLSTWIASIAYNMCIDYIRKKGREKLEIHEDPLLLMKDGDGQENAGVKLNLAEMKTMINTLLEALPLHYRTVMTLFYLEELSYREMEMITGMPEGTIKSYLNRGRQMIKVKVEQHYPEYIPEMKG